MWEPLQQGSSGEVVMKTPGLSLWPEIPSVSSEILLTQVAWMLIRLPLPGKQRLSESKRKGAEEQFGGRNSCYGGGSQDLCFSTQLQGMAGGGGGGVHFRGLGFALDGCMTLNKSFWLVLSLPALTCLLYADGSHPYILTLNLPTELELLSTVGWGPLQRTLAKINIP